MHALIIEPQAFMACEIEYALRDIGFTSFAFAIGAEEAVAAAAEQQPDLVTAAVTLTPGCGISAAQTICSANETPVVFITHSERVVREREPHADVVRKQPFLLTELARAVRAAKSLHRRARG